jgi:hypothetical protein
LSGSGTSHLERRRSRQEFGWEYNNRHDVYGAAALFSSDISAPPLIAVVLETVSIWLLKEK